MHSYALYKTLLKNFLINYSSIEFLDSQNRKKFKKFKYLENINNILNGSTNFFIFQLQDINRATFPEELKWVFLSNTHRFLKIIKTSINEIMEEIFPMISSAVRHERSKKKEKFLGINIPSTISANCDRYQIVIKPGVDYCANSFKIINADFIGRCIFLDGIIIEMQDVKICIKKATYTCMSCNSNFIQIIDEENFKPFFRCPSRHCNYSKLSNNVFLNTTLTEFEKSQEIKICQDIFNQCSEQEDRFLRVKIFGDMIKNFRIGDRLKVGGTLIPCHGNREKNKNFIRNLILESFFIEKKLFFPANQKKILEFERNILTLFFQKNVFDLIANSFAPSIYGNLDLKKILVLSTITNSTISTHHSLYARKNINVLILGHPESGKTVLLKFLNQIKPGSVYMNTSNFSEDYRAKNHYADEYPNGSQHNIEITSFPTSTLFCLDDFEKIDDKCISYFKQFFNITVQQKNITDSIVACATLQSIYADDYFVNFSNSSFLRLLPDFHIIYLLTNVEETLDDCNLAKHIISSYIKKKHSCKNAKKFTIPILRSYILETGKIYPMIPSDIFDFLIYNYAIWRSDEKRRFQDRASVKTLSTIVQLSLALARLKFEKTVSKKDVREASRLIEVGKKSMLGITKLPNVTEKEKIRDQVYSKIRNISLECRNLQLNLQSLENFLKKGGYTREIFVDCLGHYEELNVWKINISEGKLIFVR